MKSKLLRRIRANYCYKHLHLYGWIFRRKWSGIAIGTPQFDLNTKLVNVLKDMMGSKKAGKIIYANMTKTR